MGNVKEEVLPGLNEKISMLQDGIHVHDTLGLGVDILDSYSTEGDMLHLYLNEEFEMIDCLSCKTNDDFNNLFKDVFLEAKPDPTLVIVRKDADSFKIVIGMTPTEEKGCNLKHAFITLDAFNYSHVTIHSGTNSNVYVILQRIGNNYSVLGWRNPTDRR